MIVLKSLASHGDLRTWTAYACSGDGHGRSVRAEIAEDGIVVTVGGRAYECDAGRPLGDDLRIGDIRAAMSAALAIDARITDIA